MSRSRTRASAPVAVVLLVAVTLVLAGAAGAAVTGRALAPPPEYVTLDASAARDGTVRLVHTGGPALDVRRVTVVVTVDGERLRFQPPVPFFATRGFHGGPTGPFNDAADPAWTTGERAGFRVAGTNRPALTPGARVEVTVKIERRVVAVARTTVAGLGYESSGTSATVVMARGLPGFACWTWCSTFTNPASANIRSASSSS